MVPALFDFFRRVQSNKYILPDVFRAGAVVTAVSAAILALTTVYIVLLVIDSKTRSGISTRTLPLQSFSLWFFALWLFAAQIPVSLFVSKRSIKVTASVFGVTIQDSDLKTIERQLGAKTMYKDYHYLLWVFTLAAAVVCLVASSSARASSTDEPVSSEKGTPQAAPTK
ncbi:hypothetical protein C8R43DRAFT_1030427 [Mycena crocata]|nr:hypothetical protein C8R43DRAFT_1030427 [Mycena crocata]